MLLLAISDGAAVALALLGHALLVGGAVVRYAIKIEGRLSTIEAALFGTRRR